MLQFPENYFKREIQADFAVSEIMKRVWAASLEVLQSVIDICEKHDLHYFVYWGTLLGAVRHEGFIPWDDDIDIAMPGEDYIRFLKIVRAELPEDYYVLNVYEADGYRECFTRVTNGDTIDTHRQRMEEYHNCPLAVGVDIFPLYYLPRDEQCAEEQKILLGIIEDLYRMLECREQMEKEGATPEEILVYSEALAKRIWALQEVTGFRIEKGKNLKTQLGIIYDQICRLYSADESDYVTIFPYYLNKGYKVSKELIQDTVSMTFENITVKAPIGTHEILKQLYNDYMVPVKGSAGHDYIFFKGQMEDLLDKGCLEIIKYSLPKDCRQTEDILPEEYQEMLYYIDENGQCKRKQIVLYSPTWLEMLCNGGYSMDKLRNVLQSFEGRQDMLLWWFVYPLKASGSMIIESISPQLFAEYRQIADEYRQAGWGIYDDSCEAGRAAIFADVYFGDAGELCSCCEQAGKEIFIQNYEDVDRIECIR